MWKWRQSVRATSATTLNVPQPPSKYRNHYQSYPTLNVSQPASKYRNYCHSSPTTLSVPQPVSKYRNHYQSSPTTLSVPQPASKYRSHYQSSPTTLRVQQPASKYHNHYQSSPTTLKVFLLTTDCLINQPQSPQERLPLPLSSTASSHDHHFDYFAAVVLCLYGAIVSTRPLDLRLSTCGRGFNMFNVCNQLACCAVHGKARQAQWSLYKGLARKAEMFFSPCLDQK